MSEKRRFGNSKSAAGAIQNSSWIKPQRTQTTQRQRTKGTWACSWAGRVLRPGKLAHLELIGAEVDTQTVFETGGLQLTKNFAFSAFFAVEGYLAVADCSNETHAEKAKRRRTI